MESIVVAVVAIIRKIQEMYLPIDGIDGFLLNNLFDALL